MVVPVRRRLRTKTSPAAVQRVPSMGVVRRRMRSKGPPPPAYAQLLHLQKASNIKQIWELWSVMWRWPCLHVE